MKVRLDPRMVAASTQRPTAFAQGVGAVPTSIIASSHGAFIIVIPQRLLRPVLPLHYRRSAGGRPKNYPPGVIFTGEWGGGRCFMRRQSRVRSYVMGFEESPQRPPRPHTHLAVFLLARASGIGPI